jgi:nucleotide-binding universal stress UspA family protein
MTIIVAYTTDTPSRAALDFALSEAQHRREDVVLVNSSRGTAPVDTHLIDETEVTRIRDQFESAGVVIHIEQPNRGHDTVEEMLEATERHQASMVVVGARRRSPMGKLIMGSTTQRIILEAHVPVVAVKPE